MAKTKISEFNANPALNTDIDSINIAEGCAPSGINDAIRELMSQLKDWQSGTSNDPMVIGSSGSLTLNQGTANGVAYLNGSKVVTSGSALTYNGTQLSIGNGTGGAIVRVDSSSGAEIDLCVAGSVKSYLYALTSSLQINTVGALPIIFSPNESEQMRLTSTGLGIGTSSPSAKLDLSNTSRIKFNVTSTTNSIEYWKDATPSFAASTGTGTATGLASAYKVDIFNGSTWATATTIDSSGNLGLGVTPSAWSGITAFEGARGSSLSFNTTSDQTFLTSGAYYNAGWKYTTGRIPAQYGVMNGAHQWYVAPSGTAGNAITFTQAMTLDASGNLGIGTTSPARRLTVVGGTSDNVPMRVASGTGSSDCYIDFKDPSTTADYKVRVGSYGDALVFYAGGLERVRITSVGEFLVGKTSPSDSVVGFGASGAGSFSTAMAASTNSTVTAAIYSTGASAYRFYVGLGGTVYATSTTISSLSDARYKENVQDLDVGLDAVMQLKPRKFDWKAGKGKDIKGDRGWIAQEFEQVFPDMIDTWKDEAPEGEEPYKSVRADLIPVLVKAMQEQQAIINSLKARLDAANL